MENLVDKLICRWVREFGQHMTELKIPMQQTFGSNFQYLVLLIWHQLTKIFYYFTGKRVLSDAWAFDTAQKPYVWQRLDPDGDKPSARM